MEGTYSEQQGFSPKEFERESWGYQENHQISKFQNQEDDCQGLHLQSHLPHSCLDGM